MDHQPILPFRSPVQLAEVATAGVRFNLMVGDELAATALQPVASAAWGLVDDPQADDDLLQAALAAEAALTMACGMTGERRFLADVLAYLETDPDEPALEADDPP